MHQSRHHWNRERIKASPLVLSMLNTLFVVWSKLFQDPLFVQVRHHWNVERSNAPPLVQPRLVLNMENLGHVIQGGLCFKVHRLSKLGFIETKRESKPHHMSLGIYIDCMWFNPNFHHLSNLERWKAPLLIQFRIHWSMERSKIHQAKLVWNMENPCNFIHRGFCFTDHHLLKVGLIGLENTLGLGPLFVQAKEKQSSTTCPS